MKTLAAAGIGGFRKMQAYGAKAAPLRRNVTIEADIIKQKLPENNGGFKAIKFAKSHPLMYDTLSTDHPIDLCRYQVANCYMGRVGLINSGGASGDNDFADAAHRLTVRRDHAEGAHIVQDVLRRDGLDQFAVGQARQGTPGNGMTSQDREPESEGRPRGRGSARCGAAGRRTCRCAGGSA